MYWEHKCAPAWLNARKKVVTATELRDLLPAFNKLTKAEMAGDRINPNFAALIAEKQSMAMPDPKSTGAAARGHIMEPYAVQEACRILGIDFHHWDDSLITSGTIGFSPDALDVVQGTKDIEWVSDSDALVAVRSKTRIDLPTRLLEIKSYGDPAHMKAIVTDKMKLKERYQIAAAMLVCPTIESGFLMFFNPNQPEHSIHFKHYTREDLDDEMCDLQLVLDHYLLTKTIIDDIETYPTVFDEHEIWKENNTEGDYFVL